MQGVVNAHPLHGKEAGLPQMLIGKHLLVQIADFYIEHLQLELGSEHTHHLSKQLFALRGIQMLGIIAFAMYARVHIYKRWKERGPHADYCQQMGQFFSLMVANHRHVGSQARRLFVDTKERLAVEETLSRQWGQSIAVRIDNGCKWFHAQMLVDASCIAV